MTTRIQGDVYEALKKRVAEIEKEIRVIRNTAKSFSNNDQQIQYVLDKQPLINVMDAEINLLEPLFEFYENINELNY
ncbi:MAG: hypothetical protein WCL70_07885 [Paludibacter sp.]